MSFVFISFQLTWAERSSELFWSPVVRLSVHFSHFHLLLQNRWDNFNESWHKVTCCSLDTPVVSLSCRILSPDYVLQIGTSHMTIDHTLICLFGVFVPLKNFSLIWRRHHCRWSASNFDLCSALMTVEQWGFYSVPHLLQGTDFSMETPHSEHG